MAQKIQSRRNKQWRPILAGATVMLIGIGATAISARYGIGTLQAIGPGFFPTALGVLLCCLGAAIIVNAASLEQHQIDEPHEPIRVDPRGWVFVLAGPTLFIVFGKYGGLIPATFACVFVSALGDRTTTLKQAVLLAAAVTLVAIILFSMLLRVSFPLLQRPSQ